MRECRRVRICAMALEVGTCQLSMHTPCSIHWNIVLFPIVAQNQCFPMASASLRPTEKRSFENWRRWQVGNTPTQHFSLFFWTFSAHAWCITTSQKITKSIEIYSGCVTTYTENTDPHKYRYFHDFGTSVSVLFCKKMSVGIHWFRYFRYLSVHNTS